MAHGRVGPATTVLAAGPDAALVEAVLRATTGAEPVRAIGLEVFAAAGLQVLHAPARPPRPATEQAGLRTAACLLLVLPAVGGPDPASVRLWEQCAADGLPRVLVVTGFDVAGADHDEAVALAQRLLGDDVHSLTVPMHGDDDDVEGVLDVLRLEVADSSSGRRVLRHPDPEHTALVGGLRDDLVEALLADSHDGELLDRYLEGAPLSLPTLAAELHSAVAAGRVSPALAVQGAIGAPELAALLSELPSSPEALELDADEALHALSPGPDGPVVAEVLAPADGGWLVAVRAGTLRAGQRLRTAGREVVVGGLSAPLPAGGVAVVAGLDGAAVGVPLAERPVRLLPWSLPDPLHAVGAGHDDVDGLARRDPTVRVDERDGRRLAWFLDGEHVRESLGREVPPAVLGDQLVEVRVEVGTALARPVRRALARHATAEPEHAEHEERELALLSATVPEWSLAALADDLRAASSGTAWTWRA